MGYGIRDTYMYPIHYNVTLSGQKEADIQIFL